MIYFLYEHNSEWHFELFYQDCVHSLVVWDQASRVLSTEQPVWFSCLVLGETQLFIALNFKKTMGAAAKNNLTSFQTLSFHF